MLVMLFVSSRSHRLSSRFGTKISGGAGDCWVWWSKEESTVKGTRGGVGRVSGGAKGSGRKKRGRVVFGGVVNLLWECLCSCLCR